MPSNDFQFNIDDDTYSTDNYDDYQIIGENINGQPGTRIDKSGHIIPSKFFPLSTLPQSTMDEDPNNTGPTNDFWTDYPISIDINGYIFYNGENTGINVRGPAGASNINWDNLTQEQKDQLKGENGRDGVDGLPGRDGVDGVDGLSAYDEWKKYHPESTSIEDFYEYIAGYVEYFIKQGTGNGSLLLNYKGLYNQASGAGAIASGQNTSASGTNSFAGGTGTSATSPNQFVIGKYNATSNTDLFQIGNGVDAEHSNALSIDNNGNLIVSGNITDGTNNILSNKVDKITGKQLSTNDFTDSYKNFIDNYTVDNTLIPNSHNPISNSAVTQAILEITNNDPRTEVVDEDENINYPILLLKETEASTTDSTIKLKKTKYSTGFLYNPVKNNFINNKFNTISHENILAFGYNLVSTFNNQILLGRYNETDSNTNYILQIGNGTQQLRKNLLSLTDTGDLSVDGSIIDGNGVSVTQLYNAITNLQTSLDGLLNIPDDTFPNNKYRIGVDNGEFYIQLQENE